MTDHESESHLPASLGRLFGQPPEAPISHPRRNAAEIDGALAAPELCQLAEAFDDRRMPAHALGQVKIDGIRCLYIGGALYTREGQPLDAANHCLPMLRAIEEAFGCPMFLDGEYVEDGGLEATIAAFRSGKGAGVLWLFDAVPLMQWKSGQPSAKLFGQRVRDLGEAFDAARNGWGDNPAPHAVGFIEPADLGGQAINAYALAESLWANGYEGLMVKDARAPYIRGRSRAWQKMKRLSKSRAIVVDVLGGTRRGQATATALLCRLDGDPPSRAFKVPCLGTVGHAVWLARNELAGEAIEFEHKGFTGGGNPREPRLLTVTV